MSTRLLPFGLLLLPSLAHAELDDKLWLKAGLRVKPTKSVKLELTQHIRYDTNITRQKSVMPELEVAYRPISWLQLATAYRYVSERGKSGGFEPAHRFTVLSAVDPELGPVELSYRLQYQEEHDSQSFEAAIRNKLGVKVDTNTRFTPLLTFELFTSPMNNQLSNTQHRIAAGCSIKITKRHRLTPRFIYQTELDGDHDIGRIYSLGYEHRLPRKKK